MSTVPNLEQVKKYFDQRIREHGASPGGADWNSAASQTVRFDQLLKVVAGKRFSLLDYGCGYGALADYMELKGFEAEYTGFDLLESAIELARLNHATKPSLTFTTDPERLGEVDYTVGSGIFNVRGRSAYKTWTEHVLSTLERFQRLSRRGWACNFLTKYSDAERMRRDLYYADPLFLFDYCKRNYSKNVALLHDYTLYDFTLIVRKE